MRHARSKSYVFMLIAAFLVFAAFSTGGCGGSSNAPGTSEDSGLNLPSMFDIRSTTEFENMVEELKASGVWAKVDSYNFYNVYGYLTDEQLTEVLKEIPEEDREQFTTQNRLLRDELVGNYNNGGVLTLFHPDDFTIRQSLAFLASVSADISMVDISPDVEICAITKQTAKGRTVDSENTVQLDNIFVYVVPNIKTLVSVESEDSPYNVEENYLSTQVERWRRYYLWLAGLKDRALANANTASELKASAAQDNRVIDISRVLSGTYDWSYSDSKEWDKFAAEGSYPNMPTNNDHIKYAGSRTNMLDYQVYSVHSFTDHSDYFIVNSSLYTKPLAVENDAHCYVKFQKYGYTWYFGLRGYTRSMTSSVSLGNVVKTSMPNGVTHNANYSEIFTWSDDAVFAGQDFGAFDGVNYSGNISFDAANITVNNLSNTSSATLFASFDAPISGSTSARSGFSAYSAATEERRLPLSAVFKVDSNDWRRGYDSVNLVFNGSVQEGEVIKDSVYDDYPTSRSEYPRIDALATKNFKLEIKKPNPPMHSTVGSRYYAFNMHGDDGTARIKVVSEGDWMLLLESAASNWVTLEKTSGTATGPQGELVQFFVPENTTGAGRFAKIMLVASPYDDKSKMETTVVEIFQSNNEGISNN